MVLTLRLKFKTYDELNAWLLEQIINYARTHPCSERSEHTIWERLEAERRKFVTYSGHFDGFHARPASVSKSGPGSL